jgi:hypothetical protein
MTRKATPSMSQLKSPDTGHNTGLCSVREFNAVCVCVCVCVFVCVCSIKNKEMRMKLKCRERDVGMCDRPCFELYHTKLHLWGLCDTKMEKWSTQTEVNITNKLMNWYFSAALSWWNKRSKGGRDFREMVSQRYRDLLAGPLCVFAPFCQYEEKK